MRIKGKLLLKEGLSMTDVGELVYIAQESISIYNDGLYLNVSDVFFREKVASFIIPIIRVGAGYEDFEINMEDLPMIHMLSIDEPQKKDGWIGPFPFEFEYYTKEKFWNRLDVVTLLNEMYNLKLEQREKEIISIRKIRNKKIALVFDSFTENELVEEEKALLKYIFELESVLSKMKKEENYSDIEIISQKFLLSETENDISVLAERLDLKKKESEGKHYKDMSDEELKLRIEDFIKYELFEKAAIYKKEIEYRKNSIKKSY